MRKHLAASLVALALAVAAGASISGQSRASDEAIVPFKINVPDSVLRDLKERLARDALSRPNCRTSAGTTAPTSPISSRWSRYWRDRFDWRAQERRLNQFDQFTTTIDGLKIHFIHQKSKVPNAMPLVLTHGWPGSIYEFTQGDRSAHRPGRPRRPRRGRVHGGRDFAARIRLLGQAARTRLQTREDGRRSSPS